MIINGGLYQHVLQVCVFVAVGLPVVTALGWNREICFNEIVEMMEANQSMAMDSQIFFSDSQGHLMADAPNLVITLSACDQICGSKMGIYPDAASRLLTWLFPIMLLITNIQFASIGKERFLVIIHLLGDPLDSIYSLLSKVEIWNRCSSLAPGIYGSYNRRFGKYEEKHVKNIAVIISTIEEHIGLFGPGVDAEKVVRDMIINSKKAPKELSDLLWKTASDIIDSRTHEPIRTCSSILLYIFQVVAAFVPALGEASSPSGGRIGTAMLLSWLLPVVLLSNAIGDYNSRTRCLEIILNFTNQVEYQSNKNSNLHRLHGGSETSYLKALAWTGAIYSYRPDKQLFRIGTKRDSPWLLAIISVLPILVSFTTAFVVLYTPPTYFSCRHFLVISILVAWLFSSFLTWLIARYCHENKKRWYSILIKDTLFAVPIISLIIASSCGFLNSCWCWSGAYKYGASQARVYLNPIGPFTYNDRIMYPSVVGASLALQLGIFGLMVWVGCPGFKMMWWSRKEIQDGVLSRQESLVTMARSSATGSG